MSSTALTPKEKAYIQSLLAHISQSSSGSQVEQGGTDIGTDLCNSVIYKVRNNLLSGDIFEFSDLTALNPLDMGSF